jgi:hypothetical protein
VEVGEDAPRGQAEVRQLLQHGHERVQPCLVRGGDNPWYQEAALSLSTLPV